MAIRGQGMTDADGDAGEGASAQAAEIVYVLHPNCAWEESRVGRAGGEGSNGE